MIYFDCFELAGRLELYVCADKTWNRQNFLGDMKRLQVSFPVKVFTLKAIVKLYIRVCSFSKARDFVQKFRVSETTQKKSLQKHLKSGIYWKGNAYYPDFQCFTGWICPGFFSFKHIHWRLSCWVSSFLTLLESFFMPDTC